MSPRKNKGNKVKPKLIEPDRALQVILSPEPSKGEGGHISA